MSDTMHPRPTGMPPEDRAPGDVTPRSTSVLLLVLVVLLLAVVVWYFVSQRGAVDPGEVAAPSATEEVVPPAEAPDTAAPPSAATAQRAASSEANRAVALVERPAVQYPPAAYRAREEGRVLVHVEVAANGAVTDARILERSGSQVLDRAALEEVRQWTFRPALEDGRPVASSIEVPVAYTLDEG